MFTSKKRPGQMVELGIRVWIHNALLFFPSKSDTVLNSVPILIKAPNLPRRELVII